MEYTELQLTEKQTASQEIFDGEILHLYKDTIELPNGKPATRELIRHVGAVCIVPLTDDGKVVVERQFRYPVNKVITEIPAGKLNYKEENPLEAAKRELKEETGAEAEAFINIGTLYPACAYSDEKITIFIAKGLTFSERHLDDDEFLNVELIPIEELVNQIMNGEIQDSKTQIAVLRAYMTEKGIF